MAAGVYAGVEGARSGAEGEIALRIKLFQTADAHVYHDMLAATSQTARAFCRRADVAYECFVGVRRGWQGWHATYNRIPYVFDLLMEGYDGWVLYMDADAYVHDLDFDLRGYLADKGRYALIGSRAGGSDFYWDINIGVLLINMGHPLMQELAREWYAYLSRYDLTHDTSAWAECISDDQAMLQELLALRPQSEGAVLHEPWDFINSHYAGFVRQVMRSSGMTLEQRTIDIQARVAEVMATQGAPPG